jgi:peptidoglycan/xylan/chitin deacetylase (PgdA/CDA1 family)
MSKGRFAFLASTAALPGAALLIAALWPSWSLWWMLPGLFAYLALVLLGVMVPGLAMFAPVLSRVAGVADAIALTFDDGPSPQSTGKVLATLAQFGAQGTFFVLGAKVREHPDVLRAIAAAGHAIGLHGDTHDRLLSLRHPRCIVDDLARALDTIEDTVGVRPRIFRPPVGHVSPRTVQAARRLGLALVGWTVRARDGLASTSPQRAQRRIVEGLRPGAIVLLHDASEHDRHEPAGIAALPGILEEAQRRGLRCLTLPNLLSEGARP